VPSAVPRRRARSTDTELHRPRAAPSRARRTTAVIAATGQPLSRSWTQARSCRLPME
jgi:hypothetical protein